MERVCNTYMSKLKCDDEGDNDCDDETINKCITEKVVVQEYRHQSAHNHFYVLAYFSGLLFHF